MSKAKVWRVFSLAGACWLAAAHADAHIKLLKPASWLNEDPLGGPQKGSPCGPGNTQLFIGDDVQPVPVSNMTTTFQPGETITVQWDETIYHPGYFRIALAKTAAADATTADFPDPPLSDPQGCLFDKAAVPTGPHDNVLADGLFMVDAPTGEPRSGLKAEVKLPDEPCEHCTLQIVQVMDAHPAASCFYFHCADLTIAAGSGSADAGQSMGEPLDASTGGDASTSAVDASQTTSDAGQAALPDAGAMGAGTANPSDSKDDGGCAVRRVGRGGAGADVWLLGLAGALWTVARRRRNKRG